MSSSARAAETLWSKVESNPSLLLQGQGAAAGATDGAETTTLIVGNAGSGKSTLINSAFKASSSKQPKPTFALEYTFARKKVGSGASATKSVAHVWELGGSINEPKLLTVPISARNASTASFIICIDLSRPQNILACARRWIGGLREMCKQTLGDARYASMSDAAKSKFTNDLTKISAFPIPLSIIGTKYDCLRNLALADRRAALLILRFVAHYFGASLYCTSSTDATTRDSFKSIFAALCFGAGVGRAYHEVSLDKPVMVSAGADSFQDILLGGGAAAAESSKARLVTTEAEMAKLIGAPTEGLLKTCWSKVEEFSVNVLGSPDADAVPPKASELQAAAAAEGAAENEYPEPEVDAKRAEKDAELMKYMQDVERREALQARMAAQDGGAEEGGEMDDGNSAAAAPTPKARKPRSANPGDGAPSGRSRDSQGGDEGEQKSSRSSRK